MFKKILIANRGEIACRIIRTAHALGYETVAVFSDADANAPHVALADQAVRIGPPDVGQSYLNPQRLLEAAAKTGADALHPGYGFLSENADFAQQVESAGLVWIGPPPEAIALMGNKATAKEAVAAHDVPLVPGVGGGSDDMLLAAAAEIGYPVMIKASAGGGGRGMRLVDSAEKFSAALTSARSEALKAFGSDDVLLEKAIVNPRHIEFQVFGDQHGNVIHLGERDCSIQRRHQKVVEEAPSPAISAELRAKMGAAAVAAAKAVGYYSAGTVEFLLDADDNFYFIEMNTRLQVEHPVTELITGLDLVEWMLLVAAGERLPLTQEQVVLRGHAIEVRLYAESAENDFLPSIGTVLHYRAPSGAGIRVDDGLRSRMDITPFYDAMVSKIIASGPTRAVALRRLRRALQQTIVLGVDSNRSFLLQTVDHPTFRAGDATTGFIAETWRPAAEGPSTKLNALAAVLLHLLADTSLEKATLGGWGSLASHFCFDADSGSDVVTVAQRGDEVMVMVGDHAYGVQVLECANNVLRFVLDEVRDVAHFAFVDGTTVWVQLGDETARFENVLMQPLDSAESTASGNITAPMPGSVLNIAAAVGDTVEKGQPLLVLEAMKMEHAIVAPVAGTVTEIAVTIGQQMKPRELMVRIE